MNERQKKAEERTVSNERNLATTKGKVRSSTGSYYFRKHY
jgi:hypothetical protein